MKFLIIGDNPADREIIDWILRKEFHDSEFTPVIRQEDFDKSIAQCEFDVAITFCL